MSTAELENWLAKVKDFSVSDLLTAQETIIDELKSKIAGLTTQNGSGKYQSSNAGSSETEEEEELPAELARELANMSSFSDKAVWKVARSHLSAKDAQKLRQLNHKQQKYGQTSLTTEEVEKLHELGYQYDRYILLRAHAILLLKERGYDISSLLQAS